MDMSKQKERHGGRLLCRCEQYKKGVQTSRRLWRLQKVVSRRVCPCAFQRGSLTLETSIVLPFLLCAVTAMLYVFVMTGFQAEKYRTLTQQAQSLATKQSKSKISSEPAVTKAETVKKTSAKLSYNLQRELEGLPQRLEELEAALEDLQAQVADASFFTQSHDYTQKVLAEMSAAEKALEDAFERWEYLESLKNGA